MRQSTGYNHNTSPATVAGREAIQDMSDKKNTRGKAENTP